MKHKLSLREFQVACLIGEGKANKEIAYALGITPHTLDCHIKRINRKIGLKAGNTRVQLARLIWEGNVTWSL